MALVAGVGDAEIARRPIATFRTHARRIRSEYAVPSRVRRNLSRAPPSPARSRCRIPAARHVRKCRVANRRFRSTSAEDFAAFGPQRLITPNALRHLAEGTEPSRGMCQRIQPPSRVPKPRAGHDVVRAVGRLHDCEVGLDAAFLVQAAACKSMIRRPLIDDCRRRSLQNSFVAPGPVISNFENDDMSMSATPSRIALMLAADRRARLRLVQKTRCSGPFSPASKEVVRSFAAEFLSREHAPLFFSTEYSGERRSGRHAVALFLAARR